MGENKVLEDTKISAEKEKEKEKGKERYELILSFVTISSLWNFFLKRHEWLW
jgi:hypothetical protein